MMCVPFHTFTLQRKTHPRPEGGVPAGRAHTHTHLCPVHMHACIGHQSPHSLSLTWEEQEAWNWSRLASGKGSGCGWTPRPQEQRSAGATWVSQWAREADTLQQSRNCYECTKTNGRKWNRDLWCKSIWTLLTGLFLISTSREINQTCRVDKNTDNTLRR